MLAASIPGEAEQLGVANLAAFEGDLDCRDHAESSERDMSCVAIFNNLRAGREPMHGVEAPRSEIIFRENIPGADG